MSIPDGTKVRVRLEQQISSATADEGQSVALTVVENVRVGDVVVIPEGSAVTGTITQAQEKRRMGRAGKLDFSIDRVRAMDGEWVELRYTLNKKAGEGHGVRTGVLTAGAAVVFWPAAPVFLLMKGKDVTINKGVTFDVFTDRNHVLKPGKPGPAAPSGVPAAQPQGQPVASVAPAGGTATVSITSSIPGADVEIDGAFVGNAPATLQLPVGLHQVTVRSGAMTWERKLQVMAGSNVSLNATFPAQAQLPSVKAGYRATN